MPRAVQEVQRQTAGPKFVGIKFCQEWYVFSLINI
jgi:hypothetical protein